LLLYRVLSQQTQPQIYGVLAAEHDLVFTMYISAAPLEQLTCPKVEFEHLPNEAQSLICSSASTPSCPAHVLLARVSKVWATQAARHLRLDGASIAADLISSADSPLEQREKEAARLQGLAAWLRQHGHLVNRFHITAKPPQGQEGPAKFHLATCQAVPDIVAALVAAGQQPGGLRLQQLKLPALPGTHIPTMCTMLSACHQLRELHLGNSYSGQTTTTTWQDVMQLPAVLQQLSQLTSLRLKSGMFLAEGTPKKPDINNLVESLPSRLEVLEIDGDKLGRARPSKVHLQATSLQHLVCLRQLTLPDNMFVSEDDDSSISDSRNNSVGSSTAGCDRGGASSSGPLAGLTALTYLVCYSAMRWDSATPLLALPHLASLKAGKICPSHLGALSSMSGLRFLTINLAPGVHQGVAGAVEQLTQLTQLAVLIELAGDDQGSGLMRMSLWCSQKWQSGAARCLPCLGCALCTWSRCCSM
jgi:hypothetical protein